VSGAAWDRIVGGGGEGKKTRYLEKRGRRNKTQNLTNTKNVDPNGAKIIDVPNKSTEKVIGEKKKSAVFKGWSRDHHRICGAWEKTGYATSGDIGTGGNTTGANLGEG